MAETVNTLGKIQVLPPDTHREMSPSELFKALKKTGNWTYSEITNELSEKYLDENGLSEETIKRWGTRDVIPQGKNRSALLKLIESQCASSIEKQLWVDALVTAWVRWEKRTQKASNHKLEKTKKVTLVSTNQPLTRTNQPPVPNTQHAITNSQQSAPQELTGNHTHKTNTDNTKKTEREQSNEHYFFKPLFSNHFKKKPSIIHHSLSVEIPLALLNISMMAYISLNADESQTTLIIALIAGLFSMALWKWHTHKKTRVNILTAGLLPLFIILIYELFPRRAIVALPSHQAKDISPGGIVVGNNQGVINIEMSEKREDG